MLADEELDAMFKVQDYFRLITHKETEATLKVVAADSDTVSGKKAASACVGLARSSLKRTVVYLVSASSC